MAGKKGQKARGVHITAKGYMELAGLKNTDLPLTDEQERILCLLAQINFTLVHRFVGALQVLSGPTYGEQYAHASHSFRGLAAHIARMSGGNKVLVEWIYEGRPNEI